MRGRFISKWEAVVLVGGAPCCPFRCLETLEAGVIQSGQCGAENTDRKRERKRERKRWRGGRELISLAESQMEF